MHGGVTCGGGAFGNSAWGKQTPNTVHNVTEQEVHAAIPVGNMKSDLNGCVVLSEIHVFSSTPLAVCSERAPASIRHRKSRYLDKNEII